MKSKTNASHITPGGNTFSVFSGRRELAEYTTTPIPRYQGNPLIEALPSILSHSQISNALAYYPPYDKDQRALPAEHRIYMIHTVLDLFVPLPEHIDLAERISCLIREGYTSRNPIVAEYWQTFRSRVNAGGHEQGVRLRVRSSATGMTILGVSGGGKTTATEACVNLFPQLIQHSQYRGRPFTWTQLVWLKLQCPFDGSTKGLCMNFFQAVDNLVGTRHEQNYARSRPSTDELIPGMQRVASLHSLGLLIIDEIQHLDQSRSGGSERMLNFFTQLVNTIGVPVIFIGTPKAKAVLSREFRQSRRGTGEGDFVWDRLKREEKWRYFVESLWPYQYLRTATLLSAELLEVLYDECQGIVDIAIKLFMLSQVRAIHSGKEALTSAIIRSVARDSFRTIQPALHALRSGDHEALQLFEDIKPIDYDAAVHRIANPLRMTHLASATQESAASIAKPQATEPLVSPKATACTDQRQDPPGAEGPPSTLMNIVKRAKETNMSPYDALKSHRLVRGCEDYIREI
jgi:hypothetical protein